MFDSLLGKDSFRRQCLELAHDIGNIGIHFQHLSAKDKYAAKSLLLACEMCHVVP